MLKYSTLFGIVICLVLFSCGSLRPLETTDGKLMGVLPVSNGQVTYTYVMPFEGASDLALFRQARRWVAFQLRNPSQVFQLDDQVTRDVIGGGRFSNLRVPLRNGFVRTGPSVDYTVTVECYPGYLRATFSGFLVHQVEETRPREGTPIEAGAYTIDHNLIDDYKELDRRVKELAKALKGFITENVKAQPPKQE